MYGIWEYCFIFPNVEYCEELYMWQNEVYEKSLNFPSSTTGRGSQNGRGYLSKVSRGRNKTHPIAGEISPGILHGF